MNWFNFLAEWDWYKQMCKPLNLEYKRGLWLWNLDYNNQAKVLKFCGDKKVNELYLHNDLRQPEKIRIFNSAAKQLGLNVHFLIGMQFGKDKPEDIIGLISALKGQGDRLGFKAIHLDMEMFTEATTKDFNKFFEEVLIKCKGLELPIYIDIEPWRKDTDYFYLINKYADKVVYMAYDDNYSGMIQQSDWARRKIKKPFFMGVETIEDPKLKDISFWKDGNEKMEEEISKLSNYFRYNKNFQGIAVHHWYSYKTLKKVSD